MRLSIVILKSPLIRVQIINRNIGPICAAGSRRRYPITSTFKGFAGDGIIFIYIIVSGRKSKSRPF